MKTQTSALVALLLTLVLFVALNIFGSMACRGQRIDLTEDQLYTLSSGAVDIVRGLDEPIRLKLYYSDEQAAEISTVSEYGRRVTEILQEFTRAGDGQVLLEVIDPEPYSEAEEEAVREGLFGAPLPSGDKLYFGLVATNATGDKETLPFFDPGKERFLEYDLSKLVYKLANPAERRVGFLSSIAWGGAPDPRNPMAQPRPDWEIVDQLREFFEVERIETTATEIDPELAVLFVLHPKKLSEATLYAIDQYALGGGKLFVAVDPFSEVDAAASRDPQNPMGGGADAHSDLSKLFDAWGFHLVDGKIAGDRKLAYRERDPRTGRERDLIHYLEIGEDTVDGDDPVTSVLDQLIFASAGILEPRAEATTTFEPLVRTTTDSMQIESSMLQFLPDPERLLEQFVPGFEALTLAARVAGPIQSAFPDGAPVAADELEGAADAAHRSEGRLDLVVVGDVDFLFDQFWIREMNLGGLSLGFQKISDNGDLAINAVDNLSGGEELLSLRARGKFARPFDRVEDLRRDAEQRFRAEQQQLERALSEAQKRINELQREKSPDEQYILSPEQEAALLQAREDELATKRKLRDVQHSLRKDIEALGTKLKVINILAIPLLMTVFALGLFLVRYTRRRSS
ncbi:MAG: Gldg family protein [Planctomycetota bacterium]